MKKELNNMEDKNSKRVSEMSVKKFLLEALLHPTGLYRINKRDGRFEPSPNDSKFEVYYIKYAIPVMVATFDIAKYTLPIALFVEHITRNN